MASEKIQAVHSDDIETYLQELGVLDAVQKGACVCAVCRRSVTLDNIACLYPENGEVQFICSDPRCVDAIIKRRGVAND